MYEEIFNQIRSAANKRNLKDSTIHAYCTSVAHFLNHTAKDIDALTTGLMHKKRTYLMHCIMLHHPLWTSWRKIQSIWELTSDISVFFIHGVLQ